jgi:hypothetical protein
VTTPCSTTTSGSEPARRASQALALLLAIAAPLTGGAYETDQYNNRLEPIADSREPLNEQVNLTIAAIAEGWTGSRNDSRFVDQVYFRIGGRHWVDKLERWAMKSPEVERLSTPRRESVYAGHPIWATRVAAMFGVGPTIKVNGVLIGSDKLGHFLSQGRKYWRRFQKNEDEALSAEHSAYTERALFGQMTTGVYSNADLVANYEGHRFYRSLFEDNIVPGKPAILSWQDNGWVVQRPFDFADHVNAYWDEAINVNHFDTLLYPHMRERLTEHCDTYLLEPESFALENEDALKERYAHLQLRDTSDMRMEKLCEAPVEGLPASIDTAIEPPGT